MNRLLSITASLLLALTAGCRDDGDDGGALAGAGDPGPSPLRRLTRIEYNNAIFQLFGDTSSPASAFVPEETALGYDNQAAALVVSSLLAEQLLNAAETLAARHAPAILDSLASCKSASSLDGSCTTQAQAWVRSFGKEVFRRPLDDAEADEWFAMFSDGAALGGGFDARGGVEMVVAGMLQSPHFIYRVESGRGEPNDQGIDELSPYEMANRLSFLFWNSPPDRILMDAADADELRTPEQIEAQARRLLRAPRAREAVRNFHRQWLGLRKITEVLTGIGKDVEMFPDYDPAILPLLQQETEAFFEFAIFDADASLDVLFTAPFTIVNAPLAEFYGVSAPSATDDHYARVELPSDRYSGFLSQAGLLALYAKPDRSAPVLRGKFVRERLLCQVPPPPPDVVPEAPEVDLTKTTREQLEQHEVDPLCAGCHQMLDPIGLGFEHFDAMGRWRADEHGLAIDASGEIIGTSDADGTFDGVIELGAMLGNSDQVRNCVITQWFRFAHGRAETDDDEQSIQRIREAFAASDYRIQELLVALTQTDAFRYRRVPGLWSPSEEE
ncbi:DUF1592 domain-containing protein [Paraliomyxa miuraensis]|uniref:DUF1592 domain-containing protein n=1 Tax=Paraliomyxa miuraensis TaxID=376150 RepID=UPI00224D9AB9|nr:DUF1592 domain-containing protein [Paraliomyxa miuraensis]MCX4245305.1 DUF1592 domain-containing protein [Paraliomyxa miuraensis]